MSPPSLKLRGDIMQELVRMGVKRFEKDSFVQSTRRRPIAAGFSDVIFARDAADRPDVLRYAIKIINPERRVHSGSSILGSSRDAKLIEYFKRECSILNAFAGSTNGNSRFMEFLGVTDTFNGSLLPAMVFTCAKEGNLKDYMKTDVGSLLTMKERLKLMLQLIEAIAQLHRLNLIHRDIRAENVLLDSRNGELTALLGDLGSARDFNGLFVVEDSSLSSCEEWCPPEYIDDPNASKVDERGSGDIWSYGCTVIEVLASLTPPWPKNYDPTEDICNGLHPPRPCKTVLTDSVWNFLESRCFRSDPTERISSSAACTEVLELYNSAV